MGCLALLGSLVNPLVGLVQSALCFAFARGIRRRRAWAAIVAACFWLIPAAVVPIRRGALAPDLIPALMLSTALCIVMVFAAVELWREPGARTGWLPWAGFLGMFTAAFLSFQPFLLPTASMEPTILTGDQFFVERASWALGRTPQRGDLVAFRYPVDRNQSFVKRIVGIPGDRISLRDKQLFRNGSRIAEPWAVHTTEYTDEYRDDFPAGDAHYLKAPAEAMLRDCVKDGQVVVPPGSYFVLGDNRDSSLDSRYWGFVPRADILGSPVLIYGSYDVAGKQQPTILQMRWNRLFKSL
jgi:signal peptidase I